MRKIYVDFCNIQTYSIFLIYFIEPVKPCFRLETTFAKETWPRWQQKKMQTKIKQYQQTDSIMTKSKHTARALRQAEAVI